MISNRVEFREKRTENKDDDPDRDSSTIFVGLIGDIIDVQLVLITRHSLLQKQSKVLGSQRVLELLHAMVYLAIIVSHKKERRKKETYRHFSNLVCAPTSDTHDSRRTVPQRRENVTSNGEKLSSHY